MMSESPCVFCQIIRGEAPASIVYEDEQVVAFLSNRPVNVGHTLVVPKKHYVNVYEMSEDDAAHAFKVAKRLAHAVRDAFGAEGIRLVQNNGRDAAQVVMHVHVHVIPMSSQNKFRPPEPAPRSIELLNADAKILRQRL